MANIMSMVKFQNKPSRNGFDLSRKRVFSAKAGELLPIMCIECIPDDSFEVDLKNFTRTLPVNTAAYTRIREYFDFFFVPTNLMWNKFNTFVSQMTKNNQQAQSYSQSVELCDKHPYFNLNDYVEFCTRIAESNYNRNEVGYDRVATSAKLMNYLRYGTFNVEPTHLTANPTTGEQEASQYVIRETNSTLGDIALNPFPLLAYQKVYSDYYRNSQWENAFAPMFNINYLSGRDNEADLKVPVDLFDVSNPSMFDMHYCNWKKDMFMGLLPNSQYGTPASINLEGVVNMPGTSTRSFTSNVDIKDPRASNQFAAYAEDGTLSKASEVRIGETLEPVVQDIDILELSLASSDVAVLRDCLGLGSTANVNSYFTVLALRQAQALQKWKEITQSNQQDYKSQMQAHFGVSVSDAYSDRCKFVNGIVNNIDISEVVNTNITGVNDSAIAGKGVGAGNGKLKFDTKVHGYFICIYHVEPTLDYSISGIERQNLKTRVTDYAIPEFDAIGMTQIQNIELSTQSDDLGNPVIAYGGMGYAPRYYEYKTSYDDVVGAFKDIAYSATENYGYGSWVAPLSDSYLLKVMRQDGRVRFLNNSFFKVNPSVLNPIFGVDAGNETDTDQFMINCYFDIKAVRSLDRNGLPY